MHRLVLAALVAVAALSLVYLGVLAYLLFNFLILLQHAMRLIH